MFLLWPPVISTLPLGVEFRQVLFPELISPLIFLQPCSPTQTTAYSTHNNVVLLKSHHFNREWSTQSAQIPRFVPSLYFENNITTWFLLTLFRRIRVILAQKARRRKITLCISIGIDFNFLILFFFKKDCKMLDLYFFFSFIYLIIFNIFTRYNLFYFLFRLQMNDQ